MYIVLIGMIEGVSCRNDLPLTLTISDFALELRCLCIRKMNIWYFPDFFYHYHGSWLIFGLIRILTSVSPKKEELFRRFFFVVTINWKKPTSLCRNTYTKIDISRFINIHLIVASKLYASPVLSGSQNVCIFTRSSSWEFNRNQSRPLPSKLRLWTICAKNALRVVEKIGKKFFVRAQVTQKIFFGGLTDVEI